jgi:hypothetical protein
LPCIYITYGIFHSNHTYHYRFLKFFSYFSFSFDFIFFVKYITFIKFINAFIVYFLLFLCSLIFIVLLFFNFNTQKLLFKIHFANFFLFLWIFIFNYLFFSQCHRLINLRKFSLMWDGKVSNFQYLQIYAVITRNLINCYVSIKNKSSIWTEHRYYLYYYLNYMFPISYLQLVKIDLINVNYLNVFYL